MPTFGAVRKVQLANDFEVKRPLTVSMCALSPPAQSAQLAQPAESSAQLNREPSTDSHIVSIVSLSRRMLADVLKSVEHISDVNRATHTLSMNARIEAARPGQRGPVFNDARGVPLQV